MTEKNIEYWTHFWQRLGIKLTMHPKYGLVLVRNEDKTNMEVLSIHQASDLVNTMQDAITQLKVHSRNFLKTPTTIGKLNDKLKENGKSSRVKANFREAPRWLYLIYSHGWYKIGISNDPERRLLEVTSGKEDEDPKNPTRVIKTVYVLGAYNKEQYIVSKFGTDEVLNIPEKKAIAIVRLMELWKKRDGVTPPVVPL